MQKSNFTDTMEHKGKNLIFILSQPRTGSTLLTKLLCQHSEIDALGEPRLLQNPFMTLVKRWSEKDSLELKHCRQDVDTFLNALPDGREVYFEGMRKMFGHIYQRRLEQTGKTYFLDKTPRYAYFIPELYQTFPDATYIFLFRHPLAVLTSILNNWTQMRRPKPYDDLDIVPHLLLEGLGIVGENAIVLHYEKLVKNPQQSLGTICAHLGLSFEENLIQYDSSKSWRTGDQLIYSHNKPLAQNAKAWKKKIGHPSLWKHAQDYCLEMGPETISRMGYDYDDTMEHLNTHKPKLIKRLMANFIK